MSGISSNGEAQFGERSFWLRALHMLAFGLAYGITELIIGLVLTVQFLTVLFTGRASEPLLRLGNSLSLYIRQILRFVLFNTEERPFPFGAWPDEPGEGSRWLGTGPAQDESLDQTSDQMP